MGAETTYFQKDN